MVEIVANEKKFEFLEHTADVYIAAYGKDMIEAFENAAFAMFEVMTDVSNVKADIEDYVEVEGEDEQALLYNWLEALLVKFELNDILFSKFKILKMETTPSGFELKAEVFGEKFNPEKHVQKVGIKAVTYHRMQIIKEKNRITMKFILDI
jgi:SHS2 domain-containing protein